MGLKINEKAFPTVKDREDLINLLPKSLIFSNNLFYLINFKLPKMYYFKILIVNGLKHFDSSSKDLMFG
jgi:hypothetical protein